MSRFRGGAFGEEAPLCTHGGFGDEQKRALFGPTGKIGKKVAAVACELTCQTGTCPLQWRMRTCCST